MYSGRIFKVKLNKCRLDKVCRFLKANVIYYSKKKESKQYQKSYRQKCTTINGNRLPNARVMLIVLMEKNF